MSLPWRDKLYVVLRPNRAEIMRRSAGLRPQVLETVAVPCQATSGQPNWSAALQVTQERLQSIDVKCNASVMLSNHFVRYLLVPWSDALANDAERLALARIRFEEVYGDMSQQWSVRVSAAGYGQPCIASAVDRALIETIQGMFESNKLCLASIQPWLMTVLNRCRKQTASRDFSLLMAEPGHLCFLDCYLGGYKQLKCTTIGVNLLEELDLFMTREMAISSKQGQSRPYLMAAGFPASVNTQELSHKFEMLALAEPFNGTRGVEEACATAMYGTPG